MERDVLSDAQRALLSTERWAWLDGHIDRWCSQPLRAEHGSSEAEIADVTARTGLAVPTPLAEWWTLVGNRLQMVQDHPSQPASCVAVDRSLSLWVENQGVWTIAVRTDGSDRCDALDAEFGWPDSATVAQACRSMLISDTLIAISSQSENGPLGQLASEVSGGYIDDLTPAEHANVERTYPELDLLPNPFWRDPPRGDQRTWIRVDGCTPEMVDWATATPAARQNLSAVIDLAVRPGNR